MEFINRKPKIYVLSGKASAGKSLASSFISDIYFKKNKNTMILAYASYLKEYAKNVLGWDGDESSKPREFLQQVGVELIKNKIDDHMLINRVIEDVKVYSYFYDVIVISDARFVDEIKCISDNFDDVTVIRINGNNSTNLTKEQMNHSTETSLDNYDNYDYVIDNEDSVYTLKQNVERIINEVDKSE